MDGLPARGVRKREIIPDKVEVINLEDDNAAQDKKKTCKKAEGSNADQVGSFTKVAQNIHDENMMLMQLYSTTRSEKNAEMLLKILEDSADKKKTCKKAEGSNADQVGSFTKVAENIHDENMMLMQLYSTTRSEKNAEMLLKILEDSAKSLNNIVELEKIREENKVHVKEEKAVEAKKPETRKKDVERKPRSQPETQKKDVERKKKPEVVNKNGREEAGSSRPALHPAADERDRATEEARKKTIPCARCGGTNTKFLCFNHGDLRKDTRKCHDCNIEMILIGLGHYG